MPMTDDEAKILTGRSDREFRSRGRQRSDHSRVSSRPCWTVATALWLGTRGFGAATLCLEAR
jgi:hypothetical protein